MEEQQNLTAHCRIDEDTLRKGYTMNLRASGWAYLVFCSLFSCYQILFRDLPMVLRYGARACWELLLITGVMLLIFAFILVNHFFWMPKRRAKRTVQRALELGQNAWSEVTAVFGGDSIATLNNQNSDKLSLRYEVLRRVTVFQDRIFLRTKGRQFLAVDPSRFENGTEEDFWRLLNQKCPKALPRSKRSPA